MDRGKDPEKKNHFAFEGLKNETSSEDNVDPLSKRFDPLSSRSADTYESVRPRQPIRRETICRPRVESMRADDGHAIWLAG